MPYHFRIGIKYQYTVSAKNKKKNTSEMKMRGKKKRENRQHGPHPIYALCNLFSIYF